MTERLAIAATLIVMAVLIAAVVRRRQPQPAPTQPGRSVPVQLDRADFPDADRPYLVAVFSSARCEGCADVMRKAEVLAGPQVAVTEVEFTAHPGLHRKYGIDAVPLAVVADEAGVVRAAFLGPVTATDLWAAVAEVRAPGSTPEPQCDRSRSGDVPPG